MRAVTFLRFKHFNFTFSRNITRQYHRIYIQFLTNVKGISTMNNNLQLSKIAPVIRYN